VWVPERLNELSIFVSERDLEPVTAALMRERALHLAPQESERWTPAEAWTERSEAYRDLASRLERVRSALGIEVEGLPTDHLQPRPSNDRPEIESALLRLETRVGGWRDELEAARREREELEAAERQLQLLQPLEMPVEEMRRLEHVHLTIGTLPYENVDRVAAALFQVAFVLIPLERREERVLLAASTAREDGHVLDRALSSAFFEPVEVPREVRGPPGEALAAVRDELARVDERLNELDRQGRELADEVGSELRETLLRVRLDLELSETIRRFPYRDGVYVISGWMPARRVEPVERHLRELAEGPLVVETLPPRPGRQAVPTLVRNPRWLKPFEPLVTTFGIAGYDEINPTLIAAIAFLFMYGMMFGDIGHGFLLALGGLALRRVTSFGTVVAAAGVTSMVFGALYGMAFGAEVFHALWLQPLHAIFPLLIAAVVAGVGILNLGMVLNLISARRAGDPMRFWLDKSGVLGLALYWALLGGGLLAFTGRIPTWAWLLVVAPLAAATWFREPIEEALRGRPPRVGAHAVTGFFELFEAVIAYLSNSLSFVRLGAFAVAHEGLSAMVLQYGTGGGSGWLVLLIGTALIVGFEGLIVGIQALRLSYYEFFGRFFQGRGTPFRPLSFAGGSDA
jgi:V/A-type H+-transporting ATPase subunit I